MDIVNPKIEEYMRGLASGYDEPVLLEMEAEGRQSGFPIIGRLVGVTVELLARAVGRDGEVHCTDGDPGNERKALDYLGRAGLAERVRWHVGEAVATLESKDGEFDVIYDDIDKDGYPDAWRAARDRIRIGGMYLCDNVLWSGRVAAPDPEDPRPHYTEAVLEHNRLIAEDERYVSAIIPTRDGVMAALRAS